jgi:hypothetical protein
MVDYIFGVTHPHHWHSLNIQQNPHHYSVVKRFGSNVTTLLQEKVGAGVYFNPYVEVNGVVSSKSVLNSICVMDLMLKLTALLRLNLDDQIWCCFHR